MERYIYGDFSRAIYYTKNLVISSRFDKMNGLCDTGTNKVLNIKKFLICDSSIITVKDIGIFSYI